MSAQRKTAIEWCRDLGYTILDPDGWRYPHGGRDFFYVPILEVDFMQKLNQCTAQKKSDPHIEQKMRAALPI